MLLEETHDVMEVNYRSSITVKWSKPTSKVSQLENLKCTLAISGFALQLAVVYRHTQSTENGLKTRIFQESEWSTFLRQYATTDQDIIIVGDLNFPLDIPTNRDTITFTSIIESCGMKQSVSEPTLFEDIHLILLKQETIATYRQLLSILVLYFVIIKWTYSNITLLLHSVPSYQNFHQLKRPRHTGNYDPLTYVYSSRTWSNMNYL